MLGFSYLTYLSEKGYLKDGKARILDVGTQNLLNCSIEDMTGFVKRYRKSGLDDATVEEIKRLHYFTTPRPGETTAFVAELMALTDIKYQGIDVCAAPATRIVDLNIERIPDDFRGKFDVVLNFGTLEHVIGQTNAMMFIHDALTVDGICLHQPPSVGWVNHGYFAYHPQFFRDVSEANDYVIEDLWYASAGVGPLVDDSIPHRDPDDALNDLKPGQFENTGKYFNLCVVVRKTSPEPFKLPLELKTSHSSVDESVKSMYSPEYEDAFKNIESMKNRGGIDSDDKLREVLNLIQSVPRGKDDQLHPIIDRWVRNFAMAYIAPPKEVTSNQQLIDILKLLETVPRLANEEFRPEISQYLEKCIYPYVDHDGLLKIIESMKNRGGIDSDDKIREVLNLIQSVPRGKDDQLHPIIDRWVRNFAMAYIAPPKEVTSNQQLIDILKLLETVPRLANEEFRPEISQYLEKCIYPYVDHDDLLKILDARGIEGLRELVLAHPEFADTFVHAAAVEGYEPVLHVVADQIPARTLVRYMRQLVTERAVKKVQK